MGEMFCRLLHLKLRGHRSEGRLARVWPPLTQAQRAEGRGGSAGAGGRPRLGRKCRARGGSGDRGGGGSGGSQRSGAGRWALAVPSPEPVRGRERRSQELHAVPHAADFDCHYRKFN
ncbi:unnamed protein product [Rangifer tarandus platyrhynchus]|uniref:Uncharacterized protein n=1 Tax=Rangifer tarandus platyrhynchus TaxID=3082113 RepID=A0ABN8Z8K4_RANTA|nr:unnamed protein product [Rangifer tarandus platyrhynchus]CAI9688546.1 unnamed protein product [Rangifer tarandus platyrhynchus]